MKNKFFRLVFGTVCFVLLFQMIYISVISAGSFSADVKETSESERSQGAADSEAGYLSEYERLRSGSEYLSEEAKALSVAGEKKEMSFAKKRSGEERERTGNGYLRGNDSPLSASKLLLLRTAKGEAAGSTDYIKMKSALCYIDAAGYLVDVMFDGAVFAPLKEISGTEGFDDYIENLVDEDCNLGALDFIAEELKDGGKVGKDYDFPVYIAVPFSEGVFEGLEERKGFYTYFIDTLIAVFEDSGFENLKLEGLYFESGHKDDLEIYRHCVDYAKESGLLTLCTGYDMTNNLAEVVFADTGDAESNIFVAEREGYGITVKLDGVPNDMNAVEADFYIELRAICDAGVEDALYLFEPNSNYTLYDCASSSGESARLVYDFVYLLSKGELGTLLEAADGELQSREPLESEDGKREANEFLTGRAGVILQAVFSVLSALCGVYIIAVCIKKGMKKNEEKDGGAN